VNLLTAQRNPYASRAPYATGSLDGRKAVWNRQKNDKVNEEDEFEDE